MEGKYLQILLIVILPILIIIGTILQVSTDSNYFNKELPKVIDQEFIDEAEALEVSSQIINYLKYNEELDENLIGSQAKEHMVDVKNLRDISKYIFLILTLILFIGFLVFILTKDSINIPKTLGYGSILTLISNLTLFLLFSSNFITFWNYLHKIIFTNDLWVLNPTTDNLISVFTQLFFISFVKRILIITTIIAIIFFIISLIWLLIKKPKAKKHILETDIKNHQWK